MDLFIFEIDFCTVYQRAVFDLQGDRIMTPPEGLQ